VDRSEKHKARNSKHPCFRRGKLVPVKTGIRNNYKCLHLSVAAGTGDRNTKFETSVLNICYLNFESLASVEDKFVSSFDIRI